MSKKPPQNASARYFTGKPCRRGHIAERYKSGGCVECWRFTNLRRDKVKEAERQQRFKENSREKYLAIHQRYRERNREKLNERHRQRYAEQRAAVRAIKVIQTEGVFHV